MQFFFFIVILPASIEVIARDESCHWLVRFASDCTTIFSIFKAEKDLSVGSVVNGAASASWDNFVASWTLHQILLDQKDEKLARRFAFIAYRSLAMQTSEISLYSCKVKESGVFSQALHHDVIQMMAYSNCDQHNKPRNASSLKWSNIAFSLNSIQKIMKYSLPTSTKLIVCNSLELELHLADAALRKSRFTTSSKRVRFVDLL